VLDAQAGEHAAPIALSTGLTEDACTRTSTSFSAGVGAGRSSRRAGEVRWLSTVMARMGVANNNITV
jgi:hypothetical protein